MLDYYLFTFESSNQAMAAKVSIKDLNDVRMVPLIPEISEGCGLAIKYVGEDLEIVKEEFIKRNIKFNNIYEVNIEGKVMRI